MYLRVDGATYEVAFTEFDLQRGRSKKTERRALSVCVTRKGGTGKSLVLDPLLQLFGDAIQNPSDKWDRRVGEKIALTRALSLMPKDFRAHFWEEYLRVQRSRELVRMQLDMAKRIQALKGEATP